MADQQSEQQSTTASGSKKRWVIIGLVLLVMVIGVLIYWLLHRGLESTDDAQVNGYLIPINARVDGHIYKILVNDNQPVKAGQLLVLLDQRDLRAKLKSALANLALQRAQLAASTTQISLTSKTSVAGENQAGASVSSADAAAKAAKTQITAAEAQAASADSNAHAALEVVASARSEVDTATEQIKAANAALKLAEANLVAAEAQAANAAQEAARYNQLYEGGAASAQQRDSFRTANDTAQAQLKASRESVRSATAALSQTVAQKASAESSLKRSEAQYLAAKQVAKQAYEGVRTAKSAYNQSLAGLAGAKAAESGAMTAPQQITISKQQQKSAEAKVRQAIADVRNARLMLSYTKIVAPVDGRVSNKTAELGQYVLPGQNFMAIVPLSDVWIVANFKETQIAHMKAGQPVNITVDTYSGRSFRGRVNSIGAASGAQFSLLPPENATGNFVKVVQRIPVKIVLDRPLPKNVILRPGMNVVVTVNTRGD